MKAIVYTGYGSPDVLKCKEVEKPVAGKGDVLIKVRAAALNPLDYHLMKGGAFRLLIGLSKPRVRPGRDVAGVVEAAGRNVTRFKPGDAVFGNCIGAFAEYACTPELALATKPDNVTFEQAASAPIAAFTALQGLRDKGKIQPGQKVLINGAAGGVGTFAVQIAKWLGAEVTGVCSTRNLEMVRSLGADHVIDYTREDFTKGGERYDAIYDLVANHSFSAFRQVLQPKGAYLGAGVMAVHSPAAIMARTITPPLFSLFVSQKFVFVMARRSREDLAMIGELMSSGKLKPMIDRCYKLTEVPEAMRYLQQGHARGKLVIQI